MLRNPLIAASGTFGYGVSTGLLDLGRLGGLVSKASTWTRDGCPTPDAGALRPLNAIGLQGVGVRAFVKDGRRGSPDSTPSCFATRRHQRIRGVTRVSTTSGARPEINISCPTSKRAAWPWGRPRDDSQVIKAVRKATRLPVIRSSPNVGDITVFARAPKRRGRRALMHQHALWPRDRRRPAGRAWPSARAASSGPAIRPVWCAWVAGRAGGQDPVIGIGGIPRRRRPRVPGSPGAGRPGRHRELVDPGLYDRILTSSGLSERTVSSVNRWWGRCNTRGQAGEADP